MNKQTKRIDFMNWFHLAVVQARDARLAGDMERACHLDTVVERYYQERQEHDYSENEMFEVESNTRNV